MKALTVHQPWASLLAQGNKVYETRSWPPPASLIGQRIAIHAGKSEIGKHVRFSFGHLPKWDELPRGAVVCTARLIAAMRVSPADAGFRAWATVDQVMGADPDLAPLPNTDAYRGSITIDEYGDYEPGRWAWRLVDVDPLDPPVPATGRQGLWNWEPGS